MYYVVTCPNVTVVARMDVKELKLIMKKMKLPLWSYQWGDDAVAGSGSLWIWHLVVVVEFHG
jgi:hypothetical protein